MLLLGQTQVLLSQETQEGDLAEQFNTALGDYKVGQYERAKILLERLAAVYKHIEADIIEDKEAMTKYSETLLLLGLCYRRLGDGRWTNITNNDKFKTVRISGEISDFVLQEKKETSWCVFLWQ